MGEVLKLFLKTAHQRPMTPVEVVTAIEAKGLEGDLAYGRSRRQVLLIETEILHRHGLLPGAVRENITTRGIQLTGLTPGTQLQVGETLLEITGDCTPCSFIESLSTGLQERIAGERGMLARVIQGGAIHVGDGIRLVGSQLRTTGAIALRRPR